MRVRLKRCSAEGGARLRRLLHKRLSGPNSVGECAIAAEALDLSATGGGDEANLHRAFEAVVAVDSHIADEVANLAALRVGIGRGEVSGSSAHHAIPIPSGSVKTALRAEAVKITRVSPDLSSCWCSRPTNAP